jgi:hypothetical protein
VVFDPNAVTIENVERGFGAVPMLSITAGVSGGALTATELAKRRKQRHKSLSSVIRRY